MDQITDAAMNFELPAELRMLKEQVRRFVDSEMIPVEMRSRVVDGMDPEIRAAVEEKAKALGLSGYDVPQEYGGQGLGLLAKAVVWSELGRTIALPPRNAEIFGPIVSPLLYLMNAGQKKRYLLPTLRGELRWCFAQTEPEAGGDPARMRTSAVRDGDHYVINGHKRFITGAGQADFGQVIAVTDRAKAAHGGISTFVVDMKAPGVKLLRQQTLVIDDRPWEILFENVRVPAGDLVGREGDGFRLAQTWLSIGRIRHAARAIGVIERCLELGCRYAGERVTFGAPLAERQSVQFALADSFMDLHQLRLMTYDAALKYDNGHDVRVEAYMSKIFGDAQSFVAADRCLTIHGGIGLTTDLPIEKFWRDQRSMMITEGPNEILKMALSRHVLKTFGGRRAD
jgi:acyl-CoA dehydrogenase